MPKVAPPSWFLIGIFYEKVETLHRSSLMEIYTCIWDFQMTQHPVRQSFGGLIYQSIRKSDSQTLITSHIRESTGQIKNKCIFYIQMLVKINTYHINMLKKL